MDPTPHNPSQPAALGRRAQSDASSHPPSARAPSRRRGTSDATSKADGSSLPQDATLVGSASSRRFVVLDDDPQRPFDATCRSFLLDEALAGGLDGGGHTGDMPVHVIPVQRLAAAASISVLAVRDAVEQLNHHSSADFSHHTLTLERLGEAAEFVPVDIVRAWQFADPRHAPLDDADADDVANHTASPTEAPSSTGATRGPFASVDGGPSRSQSRSSRTLSTSRRRLSNATELTNASLCRSPDEVAAAPTPVAVRARVAFRAVADVVIFKRHDEILIAVDRAADKRMGWGMLAASYCLHSIYLTHGYFVIERQTDGAGNRYAALCWWGLVFALASTLAIFAFDWLFGARRAAAAAARDSGGLHGGKLHRYRGAAEPVTLALQCRRIANDGAQLLRSALPMSIAGSLSAAIAVLGYSVVGKREFLPLTIVDGLWMLVFRYFQGAVATHSLEWGAALLRTSGFITAFYPLVASDAWSTVELRGYAMFLTSRLAGAAFLILLPNALANQSLLPLLNVDFATRYVVTALLSGVLLDGPNAVLRISFGTPFLTWAYSPWLLLVAAEALAAQATLFTAVRFLDELNAAAMLALVWITVPFAIVGVQKVTLRWPALGAFQDSRDDPIHGSVSGANQSYWLAACALVAVSAALLFAAEYRRRPMEFSLGHATARRLPNASDRLNRTAEVAGAAAAVADSTNPSALAHLRVPLIGSDDSAATSDAATAASAINPIDFPERVRLAAAPNDDVDDVDDVAVGTGGEADSPRRTGHE